MVAKDAKDVKDTKDTKDIFNSPVTNDIIDIYSDPDIVVRKLKPTVEAELRIELEGQSVDNSVVNAIRRTILDSIPIYGFSRVNTYIEVEKSLHMYNNDLLYNLIETLPIFDVPSYFDLENPEIYLPNEVMKKLFSNFLREEYSVVNGEVNTDEEDLNKKMLKIEFSMNKKNNTSAHIFVNTHDAILRIDGIVQNSYKNREPICIMVLKPNEEISFRTEANLGIAQIHASYEATTNAIHDELSPTKYHLWYETLGQLSKYDIYSKACTILRKKLENLKKFIETNYEEEKDYSKKIEIEIYGEDHTIGLLVATILQKCKFVKDAGYAVVHPFSDQVIITYKLDETSKTGPIRVLVDSLDYLIRLFSKIEGINLREQ